MTKDFEIAEEKDEPEVSGISEEDKEAQMAFAHEYAVIATTNDNWRQERWCWRMFKYYFERKLQRISGQPRQPSLLPPRAPSQWRTEAVSYYYFPIYIYVY